MTGKLKTIVTDAWMNILTGMGVSGKDKQTSNTYGYAPKLTEIQCEEIYRGDGFARRIIDLTTREMVREWFTVHGDTDGLIVAYLDEVKTRASTLKALRFSRIYGGSLVVMGLNDGGKLDDKLDENKLKAIEFLRVYDRYRINWSSTDLYADPTKKEFGNPQFYNVNPISGMMYRVHESRCILLDGMEVPDRRRNENQGWGDSILESIYEELANINGAYHGCRTIIDDFIQTTIKIENLAELVASGADDIIKKRLEILDLSRHIMNMIMLDKNEEYEKTTSTVSGLEGLVGKFELALSAVTGIPLILLMGQSPKGFDSEAKGEIRLWYDAIASAQTSEILEPLNRLVYLAQKCSEGPTKGKELENWSVSFNPLWQPTEKEIADTRKIVAETDDIYIQSGVLLADEVAKSRFGGDEYSIETQIDVENRPEDEPIEEDKT